MKKTISKLALLGMSATMVALPSLTLSCGSDAPIVAANVFYNYEDYINSDVKAGVVSEGLTYAEFGDLPEFKNYIAQGKTAGGIGSDYFNAQLAKEGLIKKIDFKAALGFTDEEVASQTALATKLQSIYTPEAWKTMAQFDSYIGNADGIEGDDKLFEYTIPYFMQNKVVAVNPHKVTETTGNATFLNLLKTGTQAQIQAEFGPTATYDSILSKLKDKGFTKLAVNDYMRDNLMIGSENITTGAGYTGKITSAAVADAHLDGYKAMIDKFGKANAKYETSGVGNIKNLLRTSTGGNPSGANIADASIALAYNGDALFAQYGLGEDTFKAGEVRIINPMNSMFLMDGFVVSKYANDATTAKIYAAAKNHLYKDYEKTEDFEFDSEDALTTTNGVALNFDYVNYTPAFKAVYDWVMDADNYFEGDDDFKKDTLGSTSAAAGTELVKITENTVTWPIAQQSVMTTVTSNYTTYKGKS